MIDFHRVTLEDKARYEQYTLTHSARGCEYSFANVFLWGEKEIAFTHACVAFSSPAYGWTLYPIGDGDIPSLVEALIADTRERGTRFHFIGASDEDRQALEASFPGRFRFEPMRDSFDYVYQIDALADLKGRQLQKKRNHLNRFRADFPDCQAELLTVHNLPDAMHMIEDWFDSREDGQDYTHERIALDRAFRHYEDLELEGMLLRSGSRVLAVTIGSRLSSDTFDIHFEKARKEAEGAYAAINWEFARYLRAKYPELRYLNREDDMGLPGLRKAKLSYSPDRLVEKYWVCLSEDKYEN